MADYSKAPEGGSFHVGVDLPPGWVWVQPENQSTPYVALTPSARGSERQLLEATRKSSSQILVCENLPMTDVCMNVPLLGVRSRPSAIS